MTWWREDSGSKTRWRWMERRYIGTDEPDVAPEAAYMVRYILAGTPWGDIKVHHILRPDLARDLHDHPWSFAALILRGGYIEQRSPVHDDGPLRHVWRRRGHVYLMPATGAHRIDQLLGDCWSLVLCGRRRRAWGFWVAGEWVDWKTYCEVTDGS